MSTYVLTTSDGVTIEIYDFPREAMKWAKCMLDAGEVGVLTGPGFEKRIEGR